MSEMIDKVAKALARRRILANAVRDNRELSEEFINKAVEFAYEDYTQHAYCAIEAMKKPTEAMLEAGPPEPYMDKDVWAKMIEAALTS